MRKPLVVLFCLWSLQEQRACGGGSSSSEATPGNSPTTNEMAPSSVTVSNVNTQTVGGRSISSSTQLIVRWTLSGDAADHFTVVATESIQSTSVSVSAATSATSATLTTLKSNTAYSIVVSACRDTACSRANAAAAVTGTTDSEYWQLQGTGNSVATVTKIVADGNSRLSATRFGSDASPQLANQIQLYYGPFGGGGQALVAGTNTKSASASDLSSYLSFTSRSGASGLQSPSTASTLVATVATGVGVPLARTFGAKVRLFFEATGADGKTRVMFLDSQDGYTGLDFNAGAASTCSTAADYATGGGCAPTVIIGVEGDAVSPNTKIANARQFKLGWPILDSTHWDGTAGTFMVFTTDFISGCTTAQMNHGYAVWDGSAWRVQYGSTGCPKLFTNAQAAFPMHLGGTRYKMYYGDPSVTTGRINGSQLPFPGPKKMIYASGSISGTATVVDYEDWEAQTAGRDTVFLWPDGSMLDAAAEGYLDDWHFLAPTGSLSLQVMYITITNGSIVPFSTAAILLNP